jgi:hypothetical protein
MIKKAGQAWGIDLMIAVAVIMAGMTLMYLYSYQLGSRGERQLDNMNGIGERLANIILTTGQPENWNRTTVTSIGILTNDKINQTKLNEWYALTQQDYNATKRMLRTEHDYFVNFTDTMLINGNPVVGIGRMPSQPKNLVQVTRFSLYQNQPVTIKVIIWN